MARILKDDRFKDPPADMQEFFTETMKANSSAIVEYANQWTLNLEEPRDVHRKIEQLQWMNTLIYGVSGFNAPEKEFFADFFLYVVSLYFRPSICLIAVNSMHLVTSSLFLPSIVAYLTPASQKLFLRGYLTISLAFWVSRRPRSFNLDNIAKFFSADLVMPKQPSLTFESPTWALVPGTATANQWFPIIQDAILHRDDHLCKIQRAFMHFAERYGTRESGLEDFAGTELAGANVIDGSLFIRAAGLTAKAMGRVISENDGLGWDR